MRRRAENGNKNQKTRMEKTKSPYKITERKKPNKLVILRRPQPAFQK